MKNSVDGGEAVLEAMRNLGVDYIISSPGSEWSPVWEAMSRQTVEKNDGPKFLDCWHETLAVDMALGYTAVTGRMQAVLLHAGVGLMHGSMAMLSATKAEMPMLVMSGESTTYGDDPEREVEPQFYGGVSEGGSERYVAPIVKYATHVNNHSTLYHTIVRGAEISQRTPRGPVYVNVSLEALLQEWKRPDDLRKVAPAPRTQAMQQDVEEVAALLRAARNPVVVVELAGRDPEAFHALVEMADALAVPVVNGRASVYSNFPRNHDMWQGYQTFEHVEDSDLILLVSGKTPWYTPSKRPGVGKIVSISEYPLKTHLGYQVLHADSYLEGDVAAALRMLTAAAKPGPGDAAKIEARRAKWKGVHDAYVASMAAAREKSVATGAIDALALADVAGKALPGNTIVCDETITHMPVMRPHLPLDEPQSFFRVTGGALGQGIGAALGVKLASPDRPVVLFVGDGSFLYNPIIQALGASKTHKLPIIIVVCNNKKYEAMRKGHVIYYKGGYADTTRFHHGVEIDGPEYHELGSHFGFFGAKVSTPDALAKAFADALTANRDGRTAILNVEMVK
ncbi:MAG: thiamine pyrophosphate enzyme binding protein [Hyphomicrobiales bacterium]|nr:thiamine pyrophosphate enzyme binding protein [Hyphomicrobiales bacterium]